MAEVNLPSTWLRVRCALRTCDKETKWQLRQRDMDTPILVLPGRWVEYVTYVEHGDPVHTYWCGYEHLRDFLRKIGDDGE